MPGITVKQHNPYWHLKEHNKRKGREERGTSEGGRDKQTGQPASQTDIQREIESERERERADSKSWRSLEIYGNASDTQTEAHTRAHACTHTRACTCAHTHTHTHTHIYYTHKVACKSDFLYGVNRLGNKQVSRTNKTGCLFRNSTLLMF